VLNVSDAASYSNWPYSPRRAHGLTKTVGRSFVVSSLHSQPSKVLECRSRGSSRRIHDIDGPLNSISQSPGTPNAERMRLHDDRLKVATTGREVLRPRVEPWIRRGLGRTPVVTSKTAGTATR